MPSERFQGFHPESGRSAFGQDYSFRFAPIPVAEGGHRGFQQRTLQK